MKTSKIFLYLAISFWLLSLTLPALTFYGDISSRSNALGGEVLLEGWGGLLSGYLAWLANPIFIYCALRGLNHKKIGIAHAITGLLLASTTFMFTETPNFNIGSLKLYGYGVGSYLWLIALSFIFLAATTEELEKDFLNFRKTFTNIPFLIGLFSIFTYTLVFAYFGFNDHNKASIAEQPYLNKSIFKRGQVCELPDFNTNTSFLLTEPVEIINLQKKIAFGNDILSHPSTLLAWGVPEVRLNGFDYSLSNKNDIGSILAKPATSSTSTFLYVDYPEFGVIDAKLVHVERGEEIIAFNAHWANKNFTDVYCPRFVDFNDSAKEPLKTLIKTTFRLASGEALLDAKNFDSKLQKPTLLAIKNIKITDKSSVVFDDNNIGCPSGTGLFSAIDREKRDSVWRTKTDRLDLSQTYIFTNQEKVYFIDNITGYYLGNSVTCVGQFAYLLMTDHISHDKSYPDNFLIEKRDVNDFRKVWEASKTFSFNHYDLGIDDQNVNFKLISVTEINQSLNLKLAIFDHSGLQTEVIEIQTN